MTESVQPMAVSGSFYPEAADACLDLAGRLLGAAADAAVAPKAVIAPHAGYVYSGAIAASVRNRLFRSIKSSFHEWFARATSSK